jgi:hypothetical protein
VKQKRATDQQRAAGGSDRWRMTRAGRRSSHGPQIPTPKRKKLINILSDSDGGPPSEERRGPEISIISLIYQEEGFELGGLGLTMSRSLARVVATPSYGLTQLPDVAAHAVLVTTFVPSRFSTAVESS